MKSLCKPIHPFIIVQKFGENKACVSLDGKNTVVYCDGNNPPEGYQSIYGPTGHKGIDLKASHGQQVYAARGGKVEYIDTQPRSGLDVRIVSDIDGVPHMHIYEHLLGHNVKVGDVVKVGDCIGWADNTGYSSGNHLHFELRKWTPDGWIPVDPLPLFSEIFAPNITVVKGLVEQLARAIESIVDILRSKGRKT